jgi:ferredoxin
VVPKATSLAIHVKLLRKHAISLVEILQAAMPSQPHDKVWFSLVSIATSGSSSYLLMAQLVALLRSTHLELCSTRISTTSHCREHEEPFQRAAVYSDDTCENCVSLCIETLRVSPVCPRSAVTPVYMPRRPDTLTITP